jgi:signal transduction histidine kinase
VRTLLTREAQSRTRLDLNRLLLEADPVEVQQIILNLLVNGADASVDIIRRELIVSTNEGSEAVLEVRDFGRGVEPASLPRLFQPFFTTKPHGMGMGLAICAELARTHGGRLEANNNADRGMTFRLTLPIAPPGAA